MQVTWYLISRTLRIAVVGTVRPQPGSRRNGQKTLYLFQKYLLCWEHEYIVSRIKIDLLKLHFVCFYDVFVLQIVDMPFSCVT